MLPSANNGVTFSNGEADGVSLTYDDGSNQRVTDPALQPATTSASDAQLIHKGATVIEVDDDWEQL